jgi:hypothetical protein
MFTRTMKSVSAVCLALALCIPSFVAAQATGANTPMQEDGIVKVKSAYSMDETIARVKQDIATKGIMFFSAVDQYKLAADAGINLRPSTLLIFGNPPRTSHQEPGAGLTGRYDCSCSRMRKARVWINTDLLYRTPWHIRGMDDGEPSKGAD